MSIMALLFPGHRVAFDRSAWENDGPAHVLGSVIGWLDYQDEDDLPLVVVQWDDGQTSTEVPAESEWITLATATDWYFTRKIQHTKA